MSSHVGGRHAEDVARVPVVSLWPCPTSAPLIIHYLTSWSEDTDLAVIERAAGLIDRLAKRIEDAVQPAIRDNGTRASSV